MAEYKQRIPRMEESKMVEAKAKGSHVGLRAKPLKGKGPAGKRQPAATGCMNCGRPLNLRAGLCFTCRTTAHGLAGAARKAALQEIKVRIDAGDIRRGTRSIASIPTSPSSGRRSVPRRLAPVPRIKTLPTAADLAGQPPPLSIEYLEELTRRREQAIRGAVLALAGALAELAKAAESIHRSLDNP
jgi:hypothetical protein